MQLQDTHRIVPISAYGTDEALITPTTYCRSLENVLVAVCFNLSHWQFKAKK